MRPKRPSCRELPCSPNFLLAKESILSIIGTRKLLDLLFPLSHAAWSMGQLCARDSRKLESCRAHLNLFWKRTLFLSIIGSRKLLDLLFPLSHAAWSTGILCARKGQKMESCRAHLTFIWSGNFSYQNLRYYWIYYFHSALLHGRPGYYAPWRGQAAESCRAHLTFILVWKLFLSNLQYYWIYYFHSALLHGRWDYCAPEEAASRRVGVLS
jgi:hypothetical protein